MQFIKKHRVLLTAAAMFAACLFVFAVFWLLNVRVASQKSRSTYLNDTQQAVTAPVEKDIEQTFLCDVPFHRLGVLPSLKGAELSGLLTLTVYDSAGNALADPVEGKAAETQSGVYAIFTFPHDIQSDDGVYRLVFTARMADPEENEYALVKSSQSLSGWTLLENGRPAEGSLCILVSVDRVGGFATRFYLVFALLACIGLGGLCFLAQRRGLALHRLFLCCAAAVGLLCCLILPPYAAPGEEAHINRAFNLSSRLLGQTDGAVPQGTVVRRASDNDVNIQQSGTTVFTYRELARGAFSRAGDATPTAFEGQSAEGNPLFHLAAALGLTLARLLGLGLVPALYLGRVFQLLVYLLMAGLAVKITPVGKGLLAAAGLLPLAIHLGASYNSAGLVLACMMLAVALCLRAQLRDSLALQDLLPLGMVLLLAASAGLWALPAALLALLLWGKPFSCKGKRLPRAAGHAIPGGLLALGLAVGLGTGALYGQFALQPGAEIAPVQDLLKTLLGGVLADYNLYLNWSFTLLVSVLLAFALLPEPSDAPLLPKTRAALLAAGAGGMLACLLLRGLTLHAAAMAAVWVAPLLLALHRPWGGIVKKRSCAPFTTLAFTCVAVFSLLDAFLLSLTR